MRKPTIWVSDQVRHKPVCTVTEEGWKLEILGKVEEMLHYLGSENKGADQLSPKHFVGFLMQWLI